MNKEFVPYNEALELKQLGFAEDSFRYYKNNFKLSRVGLFYKDDWLQNVATELKSDFLCLAPTYSQAFCWFRENHNLFISIFHYENGYAINDLRRFETYEEAELACLRKLIEICRKIE